MGTVRERFTVAEHRGIVLSDELTTDRLPVLSDKTLLRRSVSISERGGFSCQTETDTKR